jgi:glutathione peroxidase
MRSKPIQRPLGALLACSLVMSPLLGCDGADDATNMSDAGDMTEAGSPAGGAPDQALEGGAEGATEGGAPAVEAGTELTGGVEGPAGGSMTGAGGSAGGEQVVIEVAGMEEEQYDPIDESIPGEGMHAFTMVDINGEEVDMRRYRNRVALVINVASRCGYTRQYEDLQTLYETYKERGLVILGFPANNFGGQEPGSDEEIAEFCTANYGVTFPMFSKISVKGEDMHPLFGYLTGESGQDVSWNFNKFLVGPDGLYREHFLSAVEPLSDELTSAIEALLPNP